MDRYVPKTCYGVGVYYICVSIREKNLAARTVYFISPPPLLKKHFFKIYTPDPLYKGEIHKTQLRKISKGKTV